MRSFRLPWHRRLDTSLAEPELRNALRGPDKQEDGAAALPFESSGLAGRGQSILDLIGSHGISGNGVREKLGGGSLATPAPERTDDLVETLHAQYWRALTDPHTALSDSWREQLDSPATPVASVMPDLHDVQLTPANPASAGSIEVLLSGKHNLEDAFGQLEQSLMPDLEVGSVPEVLRLFAPAEFHAAQAHRAPPLPPALTRREHHALSVDSPLSAPVRQSEA